ncbi:MAG: MFS transporter [Minisyncoccota bacterium]
MDFILSKIAVKAKQNKLLTAIYASNIFLSFHYYFIIYVNSSYISRYFTDSQVSVLYIIASFLNLLLLLNVSKILNKLGNYKTIRYAILIEGLAISGLIVANTSFLIGLYFLIHQIIVPIILFNLDVFLESESIDETKTGGIRGTYLTVANITLVIAPSIVGFILIDNAYYRVYIASLLFLIPLFLSIRKYFKGYIDAPVSRIKVRETISTYLQAPNLSKIFATHFILQLFYAFMIIYTPIHLYKHIGFSWSEIGIMFTIMLLPFALFELPIGNLADKKYGEKEILTIGLVIMGLSTLVIGFITIKSFILWSSILFLTRTGASFVEITSDSFFFKHVNSENTDAISIYRTTRPLAFIAAPLIATISLQFLHYNYLFIILGIIVILGTRWSLALVDTK